MGYNGKKFSQHIILEIAENGIANASLKLQKLKAPVK